MSFGSFTAQLNINIQSFTNGLKTATGLVRTFTADTATKTAGASKNIAKFAARMASGVDTGSKAFKRYGEQIDEATQRLGKHNLGLKDTARIVQGILISQAFYTVARAITEATSAVWQFAESLDYVSVSYSALFGDADLSESFLAALRKDAEETIFSFEDLSDMSRRLLAYGIPKENLLYITEGLTNLGTMSGDAAALNRIALALGQIYTKGKLSAEEMRQLANAYVPIYKIVQDSFGLTGKQMGRVGDLNLPAEGVINAVVDYANAQFSAVGEAAMLTITGLKDKIADSLKNLGVDVLRPVTAMWKSFLKYVADTLHTLSGIYAAGGSKGLFEYLVPDPNAQQVIRQALANISNSLAAIWQLLKVVKDLLGGAMLSLAAMYNVLAPVLSYVNRILISIIQAIARNEVAMRVLAGVLAAAAAAWVIFRVQALRAAVIGGLAKIIYGVAKAVLALSTLIASSPIVAGLLAVALGVAAIAAVSKKADGAISSLFDKLSGLNGNSSGDILQDTTGIDQTADAAEGLGERMQEAADAVGEVGDAAETAGNKAKKAVAGLLSFDEVFKLNTPTDAAGGAANGLTNDLADMLSGLDSLAAGMGDALMPTIPDFSGFGSDFISGLKDSLLAKLAIAGIGGLLGAKILTMLGDTTYTKNMPAAALKFLTGFGKALLGAAIGYGFDALASLLTSKLWVALEDALRLTEGSAEQAGLGATIGSVIGGAIGMLVSGLPGSLLGSAIGHLAGGIVGLLWQEIDGALGGTLIGGGAGILSALAKAAGIAVREIPTLVSAGSLSGLFKNIGELFTNAGLKSVVKGGVIGMAIGFVCDAIAALLWDTLADKLNLGEDAKETAKIGQTIGSVLGTIIGGLIGGPPGALIGTAIGTFVGGFVGLFWEKIEPHLGKIVGYMVGSLFSPIGAGLGLLVGDLVQVIANGLKESEDEIAIWWADTSQGFSEWWSETTIGFNEWWSETTDGFSDWWSRTTKGFNLWRTDSSGWISNWLSTTVATFSDWDSITGDTLDNWWLYTTEGFGDWWRNVTKGFNDWWDDTTGGLSSWFDETTEGFSLWSITAAGSFSAWWSETRIGFDSWASDIYADIEAWWDDTTGGFKDWYSNTIKSFKEWKLDTIFTIAGWAITAAQSIGTWVTDTVTDFRQFKKDAGALIAGFTKAAILDFIAWTDEVNRELTEWFDGLVVDIQVLWANLWDPSAWQDGWTSVRGWFTTLFTDIKNWFTSLGRNVSNWWDSLWDGKEANVKTSNSSTFALTGTSYKQYATGGIVDKDQIARIAEGNKREAVVPLENYNAMRPFSDAVSRGVIESLAPTLLGAGSSQPSSMPPLYVGTLIADDRGLKELYKRFEVIQLQEDARRGMAY